MEEKINHNNNLSKKKNDVIKIPKKNQGSIKDIYNKQNNIKIDINKNCKKNNLRSISHSTKCMVNNNLKETDKDKYPPISKVKQKISSSKGKIKRDSKDKLIINTKNILLNKIKLNDLAHNNFYRKVQKIKLTEASNYSIDRIQSKIPRNTHRKNIALSSNNDSLYKKSNELPFYYTTKKYDKKMTLKKKIIYSNKEDYHSVLEKINQISNKELACRIVALLERNWLNELKTNVNCIKKNKSNDNSWLKSFIKERLIIQEDFNWLLWAVSYVFQNQIILNSDILKLNDKSEKKINFNNIDDINNNLNVTDIKKWKEGFIYNGVYFCLLNKIEKYKEIKTVKREIKSLNLLFLDYIQILDNYHDFFDAKPLLSSNLIFPLLGLTENSNYYILASIVIEPLIISKGIKKNIFNRECSYIYSDKSFNNYNMSDLKESPFFVNLTSNNLININGGKYLLINIAKELHPLLLPKYIENDENNNEKSSDNYIFLKYPLITNIIMKDTNYYSESSFIKYFKSFVDYIKHNKYVTDIQSLEYEMNRFGVNKCFYLFILSMIKHNNFIDDKSNNNISSLIKIYILVKLLTKIDNSNFTNNNNKDDTRSVSTDITSNQNNYNYEITSNKSFIQQMILFILSPKSHLIEINISSLIKLLLKQSNLYLEKFKIISNKLFSNDINSLYEPLPFLKDLILVARNNPLTFLKQVENKFNITFSYEIKYYTSICLENFVKYYTKNDFTENDPKIISYINMEELGFYLLIKNLYFANEKKCSIISKKKEFSLAKNSGGNNSKIIMNTSENISSLKRSIIQPNNSNYKVLNSSKDKYKIKVLNNTQISTVENEFINNSEFINNEFFTYPQKDASKNSDNYTNIYNGSCNNYNLKSFSKMMDNINSVDNYVDPSTTSNCIFEFKNDEEESEKSFNFIEMEQSVNYQNRRNATENKSSKFIKNNGNGNCKTISVKNYSIKGKEMSHKIVMNSKEKVNNNIYQSNQLIELKIEKKSKKYWYKLMENYSFKFPTNLYKIKNKENINSVSNIYKYLFMYYSIFPYTEKMDNPMKVKLMNNSNEVNILEIFGAEELENIFDDIISINPKSSYFLINLNIYLFLNSYFSDNNELDNIDKIMNKINNIHVQKILYKENNYNIIISILNGLLSFKKKIEPKNEIKLFLSSNKFFNKALTLSLIQYGEPRGRNSELNLIMLYSAWKICRSSMIIEKDTILQENLNELYHCLYYLYEKRKENKDDDNSTNDLINELYRDIKFCKKSYKKNRKMKKSNDFSYIKLKSSNSSNNSGYKNIGDSLRYKKYNSGTAVEQKLQKNVLFLNFDEDDMVERPSKLNNLNEDINSLGINNPLNTTSHLFSYNTFNDKKIQLKNYSTNIKPNIKINNIFYTIPESILKQSCKESKILPNISFPSIRTKENLDSFFSNETFFIYLFKSIFSIINYTYGSFSYSKEFFQNYFFPDDTNMKSKKTKNDYDFSSILLDKIYYKSFAQGNIIISFGNNSHYETGHTSYKTLQLPRVLYQLKDKEIISINSGWEHSVVLDKKRRVYSWGNNNCFQCGFGYCESIKGNITSPKNITELNNKNIVEISCGNEHTLALSIKGEVYSWGSTADGVLGRNVSEGDVTCVSKPGIIDYFIKNNIKIRHISSGSIHNLCLDNKSNVYSFGCSKGGQLGLDEEELSKIYKENMDSNIGKNKYNNFCVREPKLIKNLQDIEIIKISSGEAHNVALSVDGKCYVWGFGSNGQLGLGFCEDCFPSGEGMQKSRVFTPTILKDFDKKNNRILDVYCGKTFTLFYNNKCELYSTGINDLNQCGINSKKLINECLCTDILRPIKIEMFMRMKIINLSCGESHVLAITEENGIRTLFSWGSNRFGQLGQDRQNKQCLPKIINYFLQYNNSEVAQVSCGAFHSLVLLKSKNERNINVSNDTEYIIKIIDKFRDCDFLY